MSFYPKAIKLIPDKRKGLTLYDLVYRKIVLHTTESYNYSPRTSDYYGHQFWPNMTGPTSGGLFYQHFSTEVGSYALRAGQSVDTNRDGAFQIEIPWKAAQAHLMPKHMLDLIADACGWLCAEMDVPPVAPKFVMYPDSYGHRAPQRFSSKQWDNFSGICGHQHAPIYNDHGDPGLINIDYIIQRIIGIPEEDEPMQPRDWVKFVQVKNAQGQLEGPVWVVNLAVEEIDGVEPGMVTPHAVREDFGRVFGLDTTIHHVDPKFIDQFRKADTENTR